MNYKSNEDDASLPRLPQQNTLEGWLKQQKYFLTALEAESARLSCQQVSSEVSMIGFSSSYKDTSLIGLGSTLKTPFQLSYLFRDLMSKYNHILKYWWLGLG